MALTEALISELERVAMAAAEAAAAVHHELTVDAASKGDHDVVTNVDQAAEAAIAEVLAYRRPNDSIVGEEGTDVMGTTDVRWLVDPLDGTANMVTGNPHRSVSVGAWVEGIPCVGVVINTGRGDVFTGSTVSPAKRNGDRIRVRDIEPSRAIVGTGFSRQPEQRAEQARVLAELLPLVADVRRSGSPALDLCSVAAGWTHGFYEGPLSVWDYAAGEAIVRAAGGTVSIVDNGRHNVIVAGGPSLVEWLGRRLAAD